MFVVAKFLVCCIYNAPIHFNDAATYSSKILLLISMDAEVTCAIGITYVGQLEFKESGNGSRNGKPERELAKIVISVRFTKLAPR